MNKVYKVIYCKATQVWVAVSELAKGRSKGGARGSLLKVAMLSNASLKFISIAVLLALSGQAWAFCTTNATGKVQCGGGASAVNNSVATGKDAYTTNAQALAIGSRAKATGYQAAAFGNDTNAHGDGSIAFGGDDSGGANTAYDNTNGGINPNGSYYRPTLSAGTASNAIGVHSQALADGAVAIGGGARAGDATATFYGPGDGIKHRTIETFTSNSGVDSTAIGANSKAVSDRSTAIGSNSEALVDDALALGSGSIAATGSGVQGYDPQNLGRIGSAWVSTKGAVSVGADSDSDGVFDQTRQIQGVAAGTLDTDAVNVAQLTAVTEKLQSETKTYFHVNENDPSQGAGDAATNLGAIRDKAGATGAFAVTAGKNAQASNEKALALGFGANASGLQSVAIGDGAVSSANNTVAVGHLTQATADDVTVLGTQATATQKDSVAVGYSADATADSAVAVGKNAQGAGKYSVSIGLDSQATGNGAVTMGSGSGATADYTLALGNDAKSTAEGATALGRLAKANGSASVALGYQSTATGANSFAMGENSEAKSDNSIAIGADSKANTTYTTAIGREASATGSGSMALGGGTAGNAATADGSGAVAIGGGYNGSNPGAKATGTRTVAIGNKSAATVEDGVALGSQSVANIAAGVVGADPLGVAVSTANSTWTATTAAVSVGDGTTITRQITSVAAGTNDTDAVNVAQLKAAGFKLTTSASAGEVSGTSEEKVQNGETVIVDAGKNIKVTQNGQEISIATKDEVEFTKTTVGNVVTDATTNKITGLEAGDINATSKDAVNGSQLFAITKDIQDATKTYFHVNENDSSQGAGDAATNFGAIRDKAGATGNYAITAGKDAKATGTGSIALGNKVKTEGDHAVVIGGEGTNSATGKYAFAVGEQSTATGDYAIAMGKQTTALQFGSIAMGLGSKADGLDALALAGGQALDSNTIAMGLNSQSIGNGAVSIGPAARAGNTAAVAIGNNAQATHKYATAIGNFAKASDDLAIAMGFSAEASKNSAVALGTFSKAYGRNALATQGGIANTQDSIAIGKGTVAGQDNGNQKAVAIGQNSQATANKSMALGFDAKAEHANSVALGEQAETKPFAQVTTATVGSLTYSGFAGTANGVVSVGKAGAEKQIVNVAPGEISATSTDAINGSQLHATNEVLGNVGDTVVSNFGGDAAIDPDGNITFTDIGGTGKDNIHDAIKASKEDVKSDDGSIAVATTKNADGANVFDLSVNVDGTTITKDADGKLTANTGDIVENTDGTVGAGTKPDALTTAQDVADAINNAGFTVKANGDTGELINPGDEVEFINGDNIKITRAGGQFTVATAQEVAFDKVTVGPVTIDKIDGINAGDTKITNVKAGTAPTDAVNVSQLTTQVAASKEVVKSDDDSVEVVTTQNADGANIFDLSVNVDDTTITKDADGKLTANTGDIIENNDGTVDAGAKPNALTTAQDVADAINSAGWNTEAGAGVDGGVVEGKTSELVKTGEKVVFDAGKNMKLVQDGQKYTYATKDEVEFNSVTIGDPAGDNTKLTSTAEGLDVGGDKITNVADGDISATSKDAVNGSQLHNIADKNATNVFGGNASVNPDGSTSFTDIGGTGEDTIHDAIQSINNSAANANKGFKIAGNSDVATDEEGRTIKPTETFTVVGDAANTDFDKSDRGKNIYTQVSDNQITVALANDIDINSVTAGDTTIDDSGLTITGGPSVTKSGIDAGGEKITNVANGDISAGSKDAVNGSQIHAISEANKDIFGGNAAVNSDGTVTMTNIGGTGENTIHDAIQSINNATTTANKGFGIAGNSDIASNDDGRTIKPTETFTIVGDAGNTDFTQSDAGKNIYTQVSDNQITVALANDIDVNSVTTGDTTIDDNGLTITGGPSMTKAGINAGDKQIKGVSSGLIDAAGNPVTLANATGDTLTNAANIGDLQQVQGTVTNVNNIIGGTDVNDPVVKDALKTYDVSGQTATNDNTIISAIKNMNEGGIKYFHTNDDSGQTTGGAVANTNDSSASGKFATAVGYQASATAENALAIGSGSEATGQNSIAVGAGHTLAGNHSSAIGNNNSVAAASDGVFILGNNVDVGSGHTGAVVLGDQSTIDLAHTGTYTFGGIADAQVGGSTGVGTQVVSVGSVGGERQIQNVAPGVVSAESTDAINGSQLYYTHEAINSNTAGIANNAAAIFDNSVNISLNADNIAGNTAAINQGLNMTGDNGEVYNYQLGDTIDISGGDNITTLATNDGIQVTLNEDINLNSVTASAVNAEVLRAGDTVISNNGVTLGASGDNPVSLTNEGLSNGGNRITHVAPGVAEMDAVNVGQLRDIEDDANAGTASAVAAANLPQPHHPGKSMVSAALGYYEGEGAIAIGASTISDNGKWIMKGSISVDTRSNAGVGVGVGYQW